MGKKFLSNAKHFQCRPAVQHGCRAKLLLMRRTRPKTLRKCRQRKNVLINWKQWRFLFEKHFNEEEKLVIETWPRLVNKVNSWMLASFSTKPEMNDTSYCCFACIHLLNLSGFIEKILSSISVERSWSSSSYSLLTSRKSVPCTTYKCGRSHNEPN